MGDEREGFSSAVGRFDECNRETERKRIRRPRLRGNLEQTVRESAPSDGTRQTADEGLRGSCAGRQQERVPCELGQERSGARAECSPGRPEQYSNSVWRSLLPETLPPPRKWCEHRLRDQPFPHREDGFREHPPPGRRPRIRKGQRRALDTRDRPAGDSKHGRRVEIHARFTRAIVRTSDELRPETDVRAPRCQWLSARADRRRDSRARRGSARRIPRFS